MDFLLFKIFIKSYNIPFYTPQPLFCHFHSYMEGSILQLFLEFEPLYFHSNSMEPFSFYLKPFRQIVSSFLNLYFTPFIFSLP